MGEGDDDDVLDYQEKFERMQLQTAILKENNPESRAYYSALKNVKKVC